MALAPSETISALGCTITLRRVDGRVAREWFLQCDPPLGAPPADAATAAARAIDEVLAADATIASTSLFLRDAADATGVRSGFALRDLGVLSEIVQPPLDGRPFSIQLHALSPLAAGAAITSETIGSVSAPAALRLRLGDEVQLRASGIVGVGGDAETEARSMFETAEALLHAGGLEFRDVVRTWIHLRAIDRDYDALNRARRRFFAARDIDPPPASTGIQGAPVAAEPALSLGFLAVSAPTPPPRTVMHAATLNEAPQYGADFVRGLRVDDANKAALHLSGTASVDENGHTAHPEDVDAQAERMLLNLRALLDGQGADFSDVVSAIGYVKRSADAERVRAKLHGAGFGGFPIALVEAPVCRPDLLCETELLAVLPSAAR